MTIDEAIKVLEYHEPSLTYDENPNIRLALKLGIEALKKWTVLREGRAGIIDPLLPGESP